MNIDLNKVKLAVHLQSTVNQEIDNYGQVITDGLANMLDKIIDSLSDDEQEMFLTLWYENKLDNIYSY
jgi:CRISPR/Cas system CSM-associated protein Csm2 small subunit